MIKQKGLEQVFIQLLNLVIPMGGVIGSFGIDLTTDILAPLLADLINDM
jgi:hypothetical protein